VAAALAPGEPSFDESAPMMMLMLYASARPAYAGAKLGSAAIDCWNKSMLLCKAGAVLWFQ